MKFIKLLSSLIFATLIFKAHSQVLLPSGALNLHGNANTNTIGNQMFITSNTKNNVISWSDFSVGASNNVIFDANRYLNIVRGPNASVIMGNIFCSSGGEFYLFNPNGITLAKGSNIEASKVHLSTAKLTDESVNRFLNGDDIALSYKGMGKISFVGKITTNNLKMDGSQIIIGDIGNIYKFSADDGKQETLTNKNGTNIELASSVKRIDIGGSNDTDLKGDYKLSDPSIVSQIGKTLISTDSDFKAIANNLNGDYFISNDIDIGTLNDSIGKNNAFKGTIDGCFNTVTYKITKDGISTENTGLFSSLEGAKVSNLKISDANISISTDLDRGNIGALAGTVASSELTNIETDRLSVEISSNGSFKGNIGAVAGVIVNKGISSKLENIASGFDVQTQSKYQNNNDINIGAIAGKLEDNSSITGAIVVKDNFNNSSIKAFAKNLKGVKYDENAYLKDENYIVYNDEYQNKNFYTPFFVDSDYIFEYDDKVKTEYDYSDLTDNRYFRQDDYIDVKKQYTDNVCTPGTYSHTLSSKVNGTKFYFVKDNKSSGSVDHSIIITKKTDVSNGNANSGNNEINSSNPSNLTQMPSYSANNQYIDSVRLTIEDSQKKKEYKDISKESQVKAIRKGVTDSMIMNDTFLASLDLNDKTNNKTMLAYEEIEKEIKG